MFHLIVYLFIVTILSEKVAIIVERKIQNYENKEKEI